MRFGWALLAVVFLRAPSWASSLDLNLASAQVSEQSSESEGGYLATGDSVPFGYSPLVDPRDPNNFVGYPEQVTAEEGFETELNTSCPGETSGSFLSGQARDNGCHAFKALFPLHDGFHPDEVQVIRDAVYLLLHPHTRLVTVMLGADDLFILQRDCLGDPVCIQQRLPATLQALGRNLAEIFSIFRLVGFHGRLVAVQYYSLNYGDPVATGIVIALNQVIADAAHQFQGRVADAFTPFFVASHPFGGDPCAAGLLIRLPTGGCDVHPSVAGRNLLANAVEAAFDE